MQNFTGNHLIGLNTYFVRFKKSQVISSATFPGLSRRMLYIEYPLRHKE